MRTKDSRRWLVFPMIIYDKLRRCSTRYHVIQGQAYVIAVGKRTTRLATNSLNLMPVSTVGNGHSDVDAGPRA